MKNAKTILAIIIVLLAALLITLGLGIRIGRASVEPPEPTIVRDTIRKTDTVRMPAPPPDTVTKTITKVKKVPLYIATADTVVDSVLVQLPFEQHFAHLDSVADLWYSGYEAKIDSAIIYKRSQTIVEKHYITPPAKSNIIAVEAGTKDASIMYMRQFGSFYVGISAGTTYEGTATAKGIVGFRF